MIFEFFYNILTLNLGYFLSLALANILWIFGFILIYKYYLKGKSILGFLFILLSWFAFGDLFYMMGWSWFPFVLPLIYFTVLIIYEIFSEGTFFKRYDTFIGVMIFVAGSYILTNFL